MEMNCQRPYYHGYTGSRSISEVKHGKAALVLIWVTDWEYAVSLTFLIWKFKRIIKYNNFIFYRYKCSNKYALFLDRVLYIFVKLN